MSPTGMLVPGAGPPPAGASGQRAVTGHGHLLPALPGGPTRAQAKESAARDPPRLGANQR